MSVALTSADVAIVLIISLFGYLGYQRGFYNSLLAYMGFHFALGWSLLFMRYTAGFFSYVLELPPNMCLLLGMSFLYGFFTLMWVFFSQWVHTLIKMQVVEWFNRFAGAALGVFRGYLLMSLTALGLTLIPTSQVAYAESHSLLYNRVKCYLPWHYNYVRKLTPIVPSFEENIIASLRRAGGPEERVSAVWRRLGACTLTPEQLEEYFP
jgi:uncharacterized membrane protein required for colicin V production